MAMNMQGSQGCTQVSHPSQNALQHVIRRERKKWALDKARKLAIESDAHLIQDSIVVKPVKVYELHL